MGKTSVGEQFSFFHWFLDNSRILLDVAIGKHFATISISMNTCSSYNVDRNTTQPTKYSDVLAFCFTPDAITVILAKLANCLFNGFRKKNQARLFETNR